MKTVVFDFDGVISSYKSGWHGADVIVDPPVDGIKEQIDILRESGYKVVVVSSRCRSVKGKNAIFDYLFANHIKVDEISDTKPPAIAYVDDRAICFNGKSEGLAEQVMRFKNWLDRRKGK